MIKFINTNLEDTTNTNFYKFLENTSPKIKRCVEHSKKKCYSLKDIWYNFLLKLQGFL